MFAVDATAWDRCDAETSPERGFYYSASKHSAGQPIVAGWCYQWICQLNWTPDWWTAPVDVTRSRPPPTPPPAPFPRYHGLVERLDDTRWSCPLFVFDAGYDPIAVGYELTDVACEVLCRIHDDRVFHADPPPRTSSTMGRPSRHGTRFKCSDPQSWPDPATTLTSDDSRYGTVTVNVWHDLHPKLLRGHWTNFSRTTNRARQRDPCRSRAPPQTHRRNKKTLWLHWSGPDPPDLDEILGTPTSAALTSNTPSGSPRTPWLDRTIGLHPEQADRWTALIVAVLTQLRLARHLVDNLRLPWERPLDPHPPHPPTSGEGFDDFAHTSAHPPTHQNPHEQAQDAPKAPEPAPDNATHPSRKQPDQPLQGLTAS